MIVTTELPCSVQGGQLLARYANTPRVAIVVGRPPGRHLLAPITRDLIAAVAPSNELADPPRNMEVATRHCAARLIGSGVTDVLILNSHHLDEALLDELAGLTGLARCRLILAYDLDQYEHLMSWAQRNLAPDADWHALDLPEPDDALKTSDDSFPDQVPVEDFPLFRATARRTMEPDAFAQVDRLYCHAFNQTLACAPTTQEAVIHLLRSLIETSDKPSWAVTCVRGMQAASLTLNTYIKVDLNRLSAAVSESAHRNVQPQEILTLWALSDPSIGAVCAFADHGIDTATIQSIRVGEALALDLSPSWIPFLRAQVANRYLQSAAPEDLLFPGPRDVRTAIFEASRHRIPIDGTRRKRRHEGKWDAVFKLTIMEIAS